MLKRLRWLVMGAMLGVAGYLWLKQRARAALPDAGEELTRAARNASERARELGARLREALDEGRMAMREKEAELRAELRTPD